MAQRSRHEGSVLALSGGIGGAKLALGLYRALNADRLTVLANTGDDFEHLGLQISPDLDTLMYTLAGISDRQRGWGLADETWSFMQSLERLGGDTWFQLGDRDLATHVERTRQLALGRSLTDITERICRSLGVHATLLPMSDERVRTRVETSDGELAFQDYFVKQRCRPRVRGFVFDGATSARPNPLLARALDDNELLAVIVCPSNPFISIDPMLEIPGVREALEACTAPVIAISPIIGGRAVKGPTDKMMRELGVAQTNAAIVHHYGGLLDALVVDDSDADSAADIGVPTFVTATLMQTLEEREALAHTVLDFAQRLR